MTTLPGMRSQRDLSMRPSGLEPPRAIKPTRPSTLRVYQFRHGRRRGASIASGPPPLGPRHRTGLGLGDRRRLHPSTRGASLRTHVRSWPQRTRTGSPEDMDLTKRQQEIFDFIRKYSAKYGYPPTVRDIGKAVGLASSSTVHAHLANLEKIGLLGAIRPSRVRSSCWTARWAARWTACAGSCAPTACRCWARSPRGRRCSPRRTSRTTYRCPRWRAAGTASICCGSAANR